MKHVIDVLKQIEIHVDPVKGYDFSLVRASWDGERIRDWDTGLNLFQVAVFVKNDKIDLMLEDIKSPEDTKKHEMVLKRKNSNSYDGRIWLISDLVSDVKEVFRTGDVLWRHHHEGNIPEGFTPYFVSYYDHAIFDVKTEKYAIGRYEDSILESQWKLEDLIKFSETVDWLNFKDVKYVKTKIDYVRGNGNTAYLVATCPPDVLHEIREKTDSFAIFDAILEHHIGKEATEKFRAHPQNDDW